MLNQWGIVFKCPFCNELMNISKNSLGEKISCIYCKNDFLFPDEIPFDKMLFIKGKYYKTKSQEQEKSELYA